LVLLHLLRWLKANREDLEADVLLMKGGELEDAYREVARVTVLPAPRPPSRFENLINKIRRKLEFYRPFSPPDLSPFETTYDAVLGNTIVSLPILAYFRKRGNRTICWIHEMENLIRDYYSSRRFASLCDHMDHLIVPSNVAGEVLRKFGVSASSSLVYDFSPPIRTGMDRLAPPPNLPDDAFVVVGCGTIEPRKGVDIFIEVARRAMRQFENIYFVWIGGSSSDDDPYALEIKKAIAGSEIAGRIIMTGKLSDLRGHFSRMDVFALTSREDPFPLVCLHAAEFGKPVVCFAGAGGIPFVDVDAFSSAIAHYYDDRLALVNAGQAAKRKFEGRFSMEHSCLSIAKILEGK
jgi:glycosyltransferase involved in cell wall biosynthesis